MTPAVVFFKDQIYRACRGSDQRVYYAGPDTKGAWHMVDKNSQVDHGRVDGDHRPAGRTVISYDNSAGNVCTYQREIGRRRVGVVKPGRQREMTISLERAARPRCSAPRPRRRSTSTAAIAGHGGSGSGPTPAGPSHSTSPGCTSPRRSAAIPTR